MNKKFKPVQYSYPLHKVKLPLGKRELGKSSLSILNPLGSSELGSSSSSI
jgi:hypothetical protein